MRRAAGARAAGRAADAVRRATLALAVGFLLAAEAWAAAGVWRFLTQD